MQLPGWFYLTFLTPLVLIGLVVVNVLLYLRDKKRDQLYPLVGFVLLLIQSLVVYIPLPTTSANTVIAGKIFMTAVGYGLILVYMVKTLKSGSKSTAKPAVKKVTKKKSKSSKSSSKKKK